MFVVRNIEEFTSNSEVHSINSHHKSDLYPPSIKLTKYQKGVYYSGIKIFSHLPQNIKNLSWNANKFKLALKRFLLMGSFYTLSNGATAQGGPRPPLGVSSILPGLGRLLSNFYILASLHLQPLHLPNAVWVSLWDVFLLAH
jgi:hypothetical protein